MDALYKHWLARDPDPNTREELEALIAQNAWKELDDRFATRLAFGTAGLRGVLGAGPNRMNRLVVRETTTGLAAYLLATIRSGAQRGVVVGYDGRVLSREFAEDTACVLAAHGIHVHLFDTPVPTPVTAFAVRHLHAAAGVMVTASHNPPEYNGYKVYWENGAQIIPPVDGGIARAIDEAAQREVPYIPLDAAHKRGVLRLLRDDVVQQYLEGVAKLSVHPERDGRAKLCIAYTPLHGVGAATTERALTQAGFTNVHTVAAQREPDGRFPTVRFPNPEEPGAMDAVLALAREKNADLVVANDPDADRLAVAVRDAKGDYVQLTGDQVGVLLGADLIEHAPPKACVATTIVSSRMLGEIARAHGVEYFETLTGFKWIANGGLEREAKGGVFVFGYEEALGYTVGGLVRDKDGVSAVVAICELAQALARDGKTLLSRLEELYRKHGLYLTQQKSLAQEPGESVGAKLRDRGPTRIADLDVLCVEDLQQRERRFADGRKEALTLPTSDVLVYHLAGDSRVIVRPSGTEPKFKCYYEVRESASPSEMLDDTMRRARARLDALLHAHQAELEPI